MQAVAIAQAGTLVSFDLNFRPPLAPAARHVLRDCDVFFPSVDEIALLPGIDAPDDIVRWSHNQSAHAVVLELGARGCLTSGGDGGVHIAGMPVTPVDATGAGDCFAGACLATIGRRATLAEAARFANVAAALSTRGYGAVDTLPRETEVEAGLGSSTSTAVALRRQCRRGVGRVKVGERTMRWPMYHITPSIGRGLAAAPQHSDVGNGGLHVGEHRLDRTTVLTGLGSVSVPRRRSAKGFVPARRTSGARRGRCRCAGMKASACCGIW